MAFAGTTFSAPTNCGGFPDVFANPELSPAGLLPDSAQAVEVQLPLDPSRREESRRSRQECLRHVS
jgi:hypothetical protein